jgi:hypothetical protein
VRHIGNRQTARAGGHRPGRGTVTSRLRSAVRQPRRNVARAAMAVIMAAIGALVGATAPSSPALAVAGGTTPPPPLVCTGDGASGHRVQVIYVYEDVNNLSVYEPAIRQAIWEAQTNINDSARRDGGQRFLRYAHDNNGGTCHAVINTVQVPVGTTNTGNWIHENGFNADNRIYLMFGDHFDSCSTDIEGGDWDDSTPSASNRYNNRALRIIIPPGCMEGHTTTHELTHALGGVNAAAPHGDGGGHCTDGNETLCQTGSAAVCPDPISIRYLDCNGDDYFSLNPTGSYLPTHFNVALHSSYLDHGPPVIPVTAPLPLRPQYLKAVDVEGTSIAFAWRAPGNAQGITAYQIFRNAQLVAHIPASERRNTARVDWLAPNTLGYYSIRSVVTSGASSRYSTLTPGLAVTTTSGSATAGALESGAVMLLSNDNVQLDGDYQGAFQTLDNGNATTEDAGVLQHPRHEDVNQRWELTSAAGGTFAITSKFSGKCLSVLGGSTSVGAPLAQRTCTAAADQRWTFVPTSNGAYQLKNANSNLCVESDGLSADMLVRMEQGSCNTGLASQRWTLHRLS